LEEKNGTVPQHKITLYQSIIKKDKMEWVVEKATELGVTKIVPIISERSEKKGFNVDRARKIAIEASEQCGRGDIPQIVEPITIEKAISQAEKAIVFDSSGKSLKELDKIETKSIFIGPEGGWSENEISKFKSQNFEILNLGDLTLRAETAAIVSLAALGLLH